MHASYALPCAPRSPVFDLGNLWLEQQRRPIEAEQQAALAALVWRRPLASDFLRCMAANLPWAAQHVAASPLRPARLPPSLDGRFSFTAEVRPQRPALSDATRGSAALPGLVRWRCACARCSAPDWHVPPPLPLPV